MLVDLGVSEHDNGRLEEDERGYGDAVEEK